MALQIQYDINTEVISQANEELETLDATTKKTQGTTDAWNKSVGGLGDQLQGVANRLTIFGSGIGDVAANSTGAIKGVKGLTTGFKALDVLLKASVIGLVVAAIVSLGVAATKTATGAKFLRDAMATLEGVMNGVLDVILNIDKIFSRNIIDVFDKNIKQAVSLARAQRQLEISIKRTAVATSALSVEAEKYNQIADDATLSLREQQAAAEQAARLQLEIAELQERTARRAVELAEREVAAAVRRGETNLDDYLDKLNEAKIAFDQAQAEVVVSALQNAQRIRQIDQDSFEQRLDFLIDYTDNAKTINERILADDTRTIQERQQILNATIAQTDAAFERAFEMFNKQAGQRLDINMLLQESDAEVVSSYLRGTNLSEIETTRILEFLRERRTFTQDLAEAQRDLNKEQEEQFAKQREAISQTLDREFEARTRLAILQEEDAVKREIAARNLLLLEAETQAERELIIAESEQRITAIREEEAEKRNELKELELDATVQLFNSITAIAQASAEDNKALAFIQLLLNQAVAISKALASGFTGEPISSIASIATLLGIVGSTIAQAKSLFNSTPDFQPSNFYDGGINIQGPDGIDRIPAMITRGESVLTQKETSDFMPTLYAMRKGSIDPDILNSVASGETGGIAAVPTVVEVPRDRFSFDEDGFTARIVRRNTTIIKKQSRYKMK